MSADPVASVIQRVKATVVQRGDDPVFEIDPDDVESVAAHFKGVVHGAELSVVANPKPKKSTRKPRLAASTATAAPATATAATSSAGAANKPPSTGVYTTEYLF